MTDSHKPLAKAPEVAIQQDTQQDKLHPLIVALSNGKISVEQIEKVMDLQKRYEKDEAQKAYSQAMVKLKKDMPSIIDRDKRVSYNKVKYTFAHLSTVMEQVEPHLHKHGFSICWIPQNTDRLVSVTCRLTHEGGHSEECTMSAPPDNTGSKNPTQAIGSTQSYLERYTGSALLGVVSRDMPDADLPVDAEDAVDTDKNLQALAYLKSVGITIQVAQEYVQRDVKYWTANDLKRLKELCRNRARDE